jgi:hypothetical protein
MMKQLVIVALVTALSAGAAYAQGAAPKTQPPGAADAGRAPKTQPAMAAAATVPTGDLALGSVSIGRAVRADGKPLPAGTYQVRLTSQTASPDAIGQTPAAERWVEFLRGGKVVGREVVTIVPQSEISLVQKDTPPARNGAKAELLRGGDYLRVWINRGGNHYLIHLPA